MMAHMLRPECRIYCPHITSCAEPLVRETQIPAPIKFETVVAQIDAITEAAGQVALMACDGPRVEQRIVQKGGYWESKKPVERNVYVCGADGYAPEADLYYLRDRRPPQ